MEFFNFFYFWELRGGWRFFGMFLKGWQDWGVVLVFFCYLFSSSCDMCIIVRIGNEPFQT